MEKILVVEDDIILNSGLCYNLELNGYSADPKYNLKSALKAVDEDNYDLAILDVNLNDGSGFEICKTIRKSSNIPVIFLTACDLEEDVMNGFELGADDYITKPFSINIFMKKVAAILRRCNKELSDIYEEGKLKINFSKLMISIDNRVVNLTPTEGRLLKIFIINKGQVLTRKILLEKLWDYEGNFVDEHTLTVNINRLRNKIEYNNNKHIRTIYGMGYMWCGDR